MKHSSHCICQFMCHCISLHTLEALGLRVPLMSELDFGNVMRSKSFCLPPAQIYFHSSTFFPFYTNSSLFHQKCSSESDTPLVWGLVETHKRTVALLDRVPYNGEIIHPFPLFSITKYLEVYPVFQTFWPPAATSLLFFHTSKSLTYFHVLDKFRPRQNC